MRNQLLCARMFRARVLHNFQSNKYISSSLLLIRTCLTCRTIAILSYANHQIPTRWKTETVSTRGNSRRPRDADREERLEVIVQWSCIRTNCYERVDTYIYTVKPHRGQKQEENGVVALHPYTRIRSEISTSLDYMYFRISSVPKKIQIQWKRVSMLFLCHDSCIRIDDSGNIITVRLNVIYERIKIRLSLLLIIVTAKWSCDLI